MWTRGQEDKERAPYVQCTVKLSQAATKKSNVTVINMTVHRRSHMAPESTVEPFGRQDIFGTAGLPLWPFVYIVTCHDSPPPPHTDPHPPSCAKIISIPDVVYCVNEHVVWS